MVPEFSRPVRIDTIGAQPREMEIVADSEERAALARRFMIAAVEQLDARVSVGRRNQEIVATGGLTARVVQSCVVTGDQVPAEIEEPFEILFRPHPEAGDPDEEIELSESDLDVIFYEGASVDVGEAVAQTLALALDPYPRSAAAADALRDAVASDEGASGPFSALAALRDKPTD